MKKHLFFSYPLSAQRRLRSDWAQSFCWFCHVLAQMCYRAKLYMHDMHIKIFLIKETLPRAACPFYSNINDFVHPISKLRMHKVLLCYGTYHLQYYHGKLHDANIPPVLPFGNLLLSVYAVLSSIGIACRSSTIELIHMCDSTGA